MAADWRKVETQMRKLIDDANTTTGNNDTNLTDGVNALIAGYGQGSGGSGGGIVYRNLTFNNGYSTEIKTQTFTATYSVSQ